MRLAYLAGPYRGATPNDVRRNIAAAVAVQDAMLDALAAGRSDLYPICPHAMTAHMDRGDDRIFLDGDIEIIRRLDPARDVVVLLPGWSGSAGTEEERECALARGVLVMAWEHMTTQIGPGE